MANCTICGTVSTERSVNKRGGAATLHNDCAVLEDMQYWAAQTPPSNRAIIADQIARIARKKQGLPVQWP